VEAIVQGYDKLTDLLAAQPVTLVHNDLSRKNILVDNASTPPRMCVIDWELAGIGCALIDFVHLRYDRLDPATDEQLRTAYCRELEGSGLLPASRDELESLFIACELVHTFFRLARCPAWGKPVKYMRQKAQYACGLWNRLREILGDRQQ
jgi:aminoglycoside phosphotransferase (APT) family kinase protein